MDKTKVFKGFFVLGIILIGGFAYYFYSLQRDLENTFKEISEALEEKDGAVEQVVEDTGSPDMLDLNIPVPEDVAAMPADAWLTPEGVGIRVLEPGDNENFPTLQDDVTIYYTGWTTDGAMFDSSVARGETATFPLGRLIAGWQSAVPFMSKGEKALIWIPGDLGYDKRPDRPDAPKGMLVFEIELLDFAPSEDTGE